MKNNLPAKIITSPLFLIGLAVLLINDFYLKAEFHNFLTGKLSDFAGLFVFSLFWAALLPRRKTFVFVFTTAFFAFWKSPFSGGFIEFWNGLPLFPIERTVDYSDLIALFVLPLAWIYFEKSERLEGFAPPAIARKFVLTVVAFVSLFAFTATSQPSQMMQTEEFKQTYKFQTSSLEIAKKLQEFETDSFSQNRYVGGKTAEFNLTLHEKVCDGFPEAAFSVSSGERAEIKLNRIMYPCDKELGGQQERLQKMFESEIIGFLNRK